MTPFSLQVRKVETRCAYLLNAQTVLERMNPWWDGTPLRIADILHVLAVVSLVYMRSGGSFDKSPR